MLRLQVQNNKKKARKSTRAFLRDEIVRKSLTNISIIGKNRKRLWILHK